MELDNRQMAPIRDALELEDKPLHASLLWATLLSRIAWTERISRSRLPSSALYWTIEVCRRKMR